MPIRLVALDLDGTLLNSQSEISVLNLEALQKTAERGVEVVIVTGRRFHSAHPIVAPLPCPLTLISSNGARIGNLQGEASHRDFLPARLASEALKTAIGFRRFAVLMHDLPGRGQVVMQEGASLEGPLSWYRKNSPDALLEVADLEAAVGLDTRDPIQVMFGGPPLEIEPLGPMLAASPIAASVQLTWTRYPVRNTVLLDVMNRNCTKGAALRLWALRRGIDAAEVMALGDNLNDREMLEFAGRPVVMANAEPGVCCDGWARTLSNDDDGVAAALHRYVIDA
jgi:hydroxymethylpyrimidine pyrophosphatase-like HAD family hydrolase